jgi:hypothetical protein
MGEALKLRKVQKLLSRGTFQRVEVEACGDER